MTQNEQPMHPLRILLVEDSPEDAELLKNHLTGAGKAIHVRRVDSADSMADALGAGDWDLILSDYSLPRFDGMEALDLLHKSGRDIPFILVSGTIGEDLAVTALKAGAHDFVTKGRLTRLVPAIERELRDAEDRRRRVETEAALNEMRDKLIAISEAASDAILLMDSSHHILFWNPAAEITFGYSQEYALGRNLFDLIIPPGHQADLVRLFRDSLHLEKEPVRGRTLELVGRNKYGGDVSLELSLSTVLLGGRWHSVGLLRDITHRKALETDWMEQLHLFRTVLEAIPNPVFYKDVMGRFLGCNRALMDFIGVPMEEVIGKTSQEVIPVRDLMDLQQKMDQEVLAARRCLTCETEVYHVDGSVHTVIESKAPFFDLSGGVAGIVGTMLDITERKRNELERAKLEIQLRQAQKMEAIGQLAAGIAHEINTPTQFIGDNTVFLRDAFGDLLNFMQWLQVRSVQLDSDPVATLQELRSRIHALDLEYITEEIPKAIQQTQDGIARVARIVGAMKDFSHPGMEAKVHVDLNRIIDSTIIISHNEWKFLADVETDYDPDLPPVPCYPGEFNQVILNLVVNAAHAIAEAQTSRRDGEKGRIRISTRHTGDEVVICIEDNGTGIPESIQRKIFEPFFTTKGIGKGTGQGLAIVHSVIVDLHRGRLSLESEVGKGTTFIIGLPLEG